jgi:hypothetical protein
MKLHHLFLLSLALASPAAAQLDATLLPDGQDHRVQVRHLTEGWTWTSEPMDGKPVAHGDKAVSLVDLDGDRSPEVIATFDDQAPGGRVHVFRREPGRPACAPVMSEVGPGMQPRDFLVWDVSNGQTAPVTVNSTGDIRIRARYFGMLGVGETMATYRYRLQNGMIRLLETVPDPGRRASVGGR